MPRHSRLTLNVAGIYGIGLLLIGLWPTHVDKNVNVVGSAPVQWMIRHLDLAPTTAYNVIEFSANVALFVPLGVLAMTLSRRSRWMHVVLLGFIVSSAVEIFQNVARPDRTASWVDVLANTSGTAVGTVLVVLWRVRHAVVTRHVAKPR